MENECGEPAARAPSGDSERTAGSFRRHAAGRPAGGAPGPAAPRKLRHGRGRAGYHSPVCSIMGAAIDRIAEAIDQLAADARDMAGEPELTARVADLWRMLGAIDPELARRAQGYAAPAGGASPD